MTAAALPNVADGELVLPEPVGKQIEWLDSPAPRKVLRVGRRGSKTRFAFLASLLGHGPGWAQDEPLFPGVLQGWDVIWFAQTYTNLSTVLWHEEVVPRMGHLPWVTLNDTKHDIAIPGVGSLMLRSADPDAIKSVRGAGKRLKGVIVDEAAWLALRAALLDIILPALLDNDGWLILMSTTNAGKDGGYDDQGAPQVPSYFNVICEEIRAAKRGPDWVEFTGTAYDNPTLDAKAIDALVAEYPPDSPKLKQEVYAELLKAGVGLALPHLSSERHLVPRFEIPSHWTQFGAFDWGFNHPWVFGWFAGDTDGNVYQVESVWGRQDEPDEIGRKVSHVVPLARLKSIHAGRDIKQQKGRAVGFHGPTIKETLEKAGWKIILADDARVQGLDNLRRYTAWEATETSPERTPRFRLFDTPGNRRTLAQLQAMQVDPDDMEDALKVDADSAGRGGDDGYDMVRYGLMSRPLLAKLPQSSVFKDPHRARPLLVKDGHLVPHPKVPKTLEELVDQAESRTVNRLPHRERLPRRRYS